jgi:hypothetical protein
MNKPPLEPLPIAEQSNFRHELWLIYSQLRDAENDPVKRLTILERSRQELGMVLNEMNRPSTNFLNPTNHQPKSPRSQAANLNCRYRQKDLTPDKWLRELSKIRDLHENVQKRATKVARFYRGEGNY